MSKNDSKNIAGALVVGLIAGYVAGVLTAPKSGKETRGDIKDFSAKAYKEAEKRLKSDYAALTELIDKAAKTGKNLGSRGKEQLDELLAIAHTAQGKAKQVLGAVRRGDATEPELQNAIDHAEAAAEDLKDFLKDNK